MIYFGLGFCISLITYGYCVYIELIVCYRVKGYITLSDLIESLVCNEFDSGTATNSGLFTSFMVMTLLYPLVLPMFVILQIVEKLKLLIENNRNFVLMKNTKKLTADELEK